MTSPIRSLPSRLLFRLADAIWVHRSWFFYPQILLAVACVFYTVKKLEFHTSRNDLVGGDKQYHRIFLDFKKEFPFQDDLVVVVESERLEKNRQFVERLGAKLQQETNLFANVFFKGDLKTMGPKALLFSPEEGLRDLLKTLEDYKPFLVQFTKATNLVSLIDLVNTQFRTAAREENEQNKALVKALPALEKIVSEAADSMVRLGNPPSPGVYALLDEGEEAEKEMYVTFGEGRIFLVTAQSKTEALNAEAVARLRTLISQTLTEVSGLNVGLTGEPVLEADEMEQSQRDSTLATIVSLIVVALIFIYGYQQTGRPLKATGCLLVGLAYTMGYTTLTVGHLNILTITFVPILIGLAIDFGVHLITRYEEELRHGRTERVAMEKAMVNTGLGIFTGAFTTAGAFFAMSASGFKGVQEMGIICGGGLLVCLVPMMTMLPVLLLRGRQNVLDHELGDVLDRKESVQLDRRARLENLWLQHPRTTVGLTVALSVLALIPARKVYFDYNLLHMQTRGLPAVIFQDKLINSSTKSVLFGAVQASSLSEATNLIPAITNLPAVGSVDAMVTYLTEDQTKKIALLSQIKKIASTIEFRPLDARPVNLKELNQSAFSLQGYLGLAAAEVRESDPPLRGQLISLRKAVGKLINVVLVGDPATVSEKLAGFQSALFNDVRETFEAIQNQDSRARMTAGDLPSALRERFVGVTGKHLIQVYPRKDVWDHQNQEEFVRQLRSIAPKVTGTPVQLLEYTTLLKESYQEAAWYSLGAIAVLVFVHFRKISCVILALLPVAFGSLWMVGVMGWLDIPFNPANIMTLPLIIGIGVTNGIHILNRFAEEQHPSILAKSTGKAVLVSGLTTIAGFGSLILAEHQGIRSLGYIMSTGVATCMLVGLTFLPALLNVLTDHGWKIKKTQCDNARSTLGREEPR